MEQPRGLSTRPEYREQFEPWLAPSESQNLVRRSNLSDSVRLLWGLPLPKNPYMVLCASCSERYSGTYLYHTTQFPPSQDRQGRYPKDMRVLGPQSFIPPRIARF